MEADGLAIGEDDIQLGPASGNSATAGSLREEGDKSLTSLVAGTLS